MLLYVLGHTKSFSGILERMVVWVLEVETQGKSLLNGMMYQIAVIQSVVNVKYQCPLSISMSDINVNV